MRLIYTKPAINLNNVIKIHSLIWLAAGGGAKIIRQSFAYPSGASSIDYHVFVNVSYKFSYISQCQECECFANEQSAYLHTQTHAQYQSSSCCCCYSFLASLVKSLVSAQCVKKGDRTVFKTTTTTEAAYKTLNKSHKAGVCACVCLRFSH